MPKFIEDIFDDDSFLGATPEFLPDGEQNAVQEISATVENTAMMAITDSESSPITDPKNIMEAD